MTLFAMIVIVLLVYAKFYAKKYQQTPVTIVYPESASSLQNVTFGFVYIFRLFMIISRF